MKTALDSSALYAIFAGEPNADAWLDTLVAARREGQLVICDVVFAELAPIFQSQRALEETLAKLGAIYEPLQPRAAFLAGGAFAQYRSHGGPRTHLIPDFLVAAHAQTQADRLAASDRGYLRTYFKSLPILSP